MSEDLYLVYKRFHGRPEAQIVYGKPPVRMSHEARRGDVKGFAQLLTEEDHNLSLDQLARKYPCPEIKEK